MGRILTFLVGALFGAAGTFYLVRQVLPEPVSESAQIAPADCPQPPPADPVAPPSYPPVALAPAPEPAPAVAPTPAPSPAPATAATTESMPVPVAPGETPIVQEATAPEPPASPGAGPRPLQVPVTGVEPKQLRDTFTDSRSGGRVHDAIDIPAPRGTPVVAVDDGRVVKLFTSVPGGLTVYQFDPTNQFAYYYAHLDRYAPDVAEGKQLKRGDVVGYVGSTGNASPDAPHLHFAISRLGPEKRWWQGTAINPYPLFTER